jgi:hypothetical protein
VTNSTDSAIKVMAIRPATTPIMIRTTFIAWA